MEPNPVGLVGEGPLDLGNGHIGAHSVLPGGVGESADGRLDAFEGVARVFDWHFDRLPVGYQPRSSGFRLDGAFVQPVAGELRQFGPGNGSAQGGVVVGRRRTPPVVASDRP